MALLIVPMSRRIGDLNIDRLQREAERHHEEDARRRRKAGEEATAQAEELAARLKKSGVRPADAGALLKADQAVYVFFGEIMLAKMPPSTIWNPVERPEGMALETMLLSPSMGHYVRGPEWKPGEWTYCGRGMPGRG